MLVQARPWPQTASIPAPSFEGGTKCLRSVLRGSEHSILHHLANLIPTDAWIYSGHFKMSRNSARLKCQEVLDGGIMLRAYTLQVSPQNEKA